MAIITIGVLHPGIQHGFFLPNLPTLVTPCDAHAFSFQWHREKAVLGWLQPSGLAPLGPCVSIYSIVSPSVDWAILTSGDHFRVLASCNPNLRFLCSLTTENFLPFGQLCNLLPNTHFADHYYESTLVNPPVLWVLGARHYHHDNGEKGGCQARLLPHWNCPPWYRHRRRLHIPSFPPEGCLSYVTPLSLANLSCNHSLS